MGKATIDKNLVATSICHNHILAIIILLEIQTKTVHLQLCPPQFTKENSIKTTITIALKVARQQTLKYNVTKNVTAINNIAMTLK